MFALLATTLLLTTSAIAQMPATLLDNTTVTGTPEQWKAARLALLAALECRKEINPKDPTLRPLLMEKKKLTLIPPKDFTVFGLPVQSILVDITNQSVPDEDGMRASLVAAHVAATWEMAEKAIKPYVKKAKGGLFVGQADKPSLVATVCAFGDSIDDDYVEP
ncbi:MAG: hypothetical protein LBE62_09260 [Azonexus sp.]|jgi:hypothetical protein|nr:hypothetical protein [Azonexus sp.]